MKRNPRLFFSFRSPFSWMAVERLQRAVPDVHNLLEFIPYWEPDIRTQDALHKREAEIRYAPMSKAKHLYILQDTKRLADELNLSIVWPVDKAPWWEVSHLGWLKARHMGGAPAFYKAVTEARWLRGENISDPEVIRKVSESVGLDGKVIAEAVDDEQIRAEAVECLVEAYLDDIFGVPYFRLGWHRFWGFDRVDRFITLLNSTLNSTSGVSLASPKGSGITSSVSSVAAEHVACAVSVSSNCNPPTQTAAYDHDTAGGCG